MEGHVRTVASLHIAFSILGFIGAIILFSAFNVLINFADDDEIKLILSFIVNLLAILMITLSIPGFIAGLGLFKFKEWARILILIISAIKLLNFPIGTALGVYSIWVLVHKDTTKLFNKPVQV